LWNKSGDWQELGDLIGYPTVRGQGWVVLNIPLAPFKGGIFIRSSPSGRDGVLIGSPPWRG